MTEKKYIITYKYGKIKHFKFPGSWHHFNFARDNGFDYYANVLETGIILDKRCSILECKNKNHFNKRLEKTHISSGYLKGRELETMLSYKVEGLRNGD